MDGGRATGGCVFADIVRFWMGVTRSSILADCILLATTLSSGFDCKHANALHAPLLLGPLRVRRYELVPGIVADRFHLEPGAFNRSAIVVVLHGSADAGGPQVRIADHGIGQLACRDDVGDGKPSAWLQEARSLAENRSLVRCEIDDAVADDDIGAPVPATSSCRCIPCDR